MSIRRRAGRKAAETHKNFIRNVGDFAAAFAGAEWKHGADRTEAMPIARTIKETSKTETITFSKAYGELSAAARRAFVNISDLGFSDFLVEEFLAGAVLHTPKAEYRLAN